MTDESAVKPQVSSLSQRLAEVRERIHRAASLSGRTGNEIALVAVTKTHSADVVRTAYDAGLRDFGESYVQEAIPKIDALTDLPDIRWHFIGHLQSNKSHAVLGKFGLIQGVDSLKLGQRLASLDTPQDILIQVKLGGEATKSGVNPSEVFPLCEQLGEIQGLRVLGLMAIAPLAENGNLVSQPRPFFAEAKAIFDKMPTSQRKILSMGMSGDFEVAIEEGANMVRVGTSLFGTR